MQMIYLPTAVKKSFDACGGNSCYEVARAISHVRTAVQADKLKKAPPGSVRAFASEISTVQAAIARKLTRSRNAGQIALEGGSHPRDPFASDSILSQPVRSQWGHVRVAARLIVLWFVSEPANGQ